jgi:hypothetical protein
VIVVRRYAGSSLVALALGLLLSCSSSDGPSGPNPPPPASGDLQTAVSLDPDQPGPSSQVEASVGYTLPASAEPLGAYLIEVRFDPARIAYLATDMALTASRVVNDLSAGSGTIVVAGARADGFSDGLLFRGSFRARVGGVKPGDLSVLVREAADTRLREIPN